MNLKVFRENVASVKLELFIIVERRKDLSILHFSINQTLWHGFFRSWLPGWEVAV